MNAFNKDVFREIKNTFGRFLGIAIIVALGVSFFSGLGATGADMKLTGDMYFDEHNLMDIRVISTVGITDDDLEAIAQVPRVESVHGSYSIDTAWEYNGEAYVIKLHSISEVNTPELISGRLPSRPGEIFVENELSQLLGKTIKLTSGRDSDLRNSLRTNLFRVVGVAKSPYYASLERGSGSIGNGTVDFYAYVTPQNFLQTYYSEAFVQVRGLKGLMSFYDEYTDKVDEVADAIEAVGDSRIVKRYHEITNAAYNNIVNAETGLNLQEAAMSESFINQEALLTSQLVELNQSSQSADSSSTTDIYASQPSVIIESLDISAQRLALESALMELANARAQAMDEINEQRDALDVARARLDDIELPEWYVLDRDSNPGYASYAQDTDKIAAIGNVFPLLFFLVAALVSLTTMTRLVEERRVEIGALKSLGYRNGTIISKYLFYAGAPSLVGGLLGGRVGMVIYPKLVTTMYSSLYSLPPTVTPINYTYWFIGTGIASFFTVFAAVFSCVRELSETPASLMRPKPPQAGKRTVLEYVGFIWKRLTFTHKVTMRNITRYKKRFFMTVIGIGGCTALLLTAFGLRDSITALMSLQYGEICHYDMSVAFSDTAKERDLTNVGDILQEERVEGFVKLKQKNVDSYDPAGLYTTRQASLVVPETTEEFDRYIIFRDRRTHAQYDFSNQGVVITERLSQLLGVSVGDDITIKEDGYPAVDVAVAAIAENYFLHNIYMTPDMYQTLFNEEPEYNSMLVLLGERESTTMANEILDQTGVSSLTFTYATEGTFGDMIKSLNLVVLVLIVSAGALAFVVLLNLSSINISERERELATIEVLGFYDNEVSAYVFRESTVLTAIGALAGLAMGIGLHRFVLMTAETDLVMFSRHINFISFVYSIILTVFFSVSANLFAARKLKQIKMVEALKSVE
ncbi:MAG: ABC transporter permease [Clostridiales bacterium]|jgi:putative ABC transport system permease protein|nr:ABC transporter permease [Clostridiales bacterium]